MKREFTAIYQKRDKHIVAWIEEIPGANTQGRTQKEARENLKEALQLVLKTNRSLTRSRGVETQREPLSIVMPI